MQHIELLRNLMIMALADGVLTDSEREFLQQRRRRWGISQTEFERAMQEAHKIDAKLELPEKPNERYDMLADFVAMMAVDDDFAEVEKQLIAIAAVRLGIPNEEVDEILEEYLDSQDDLIIDDP